MFRKIRAKGFTLIEMMLVIAIMAALILMFLSYTQKAIDRRRVEKAGMDMKQFLNASLLYYKGVGQSANWPTDLTTDLIGTYLPETTSIDNPWAPKDNTDEAYQYRITEDPDCDNNGDDPDTRVCFALETNTVTEGEAKKLAALLPNTSFDDSDTTLVRTTITADALSSLDDSFNAYIIHPGNTVEKPTCGGARPNPEIFVSPASFQGVDGKPLTGFYVETVDEGDTWRVNVKVGTVGEGIADNPDPENYLLTVFKYCAADDI